MSAAPLTRTRTVAEPVCWSGAASGADVNTALSPGIGRPTPRLPVLGLPVPWPPTLRPGRPDMDGGAPPGGLTMVCAGPRNRTAARLLPARPG